MKIVTSIKSMQLISRRIKERGCRIGFVPTMGALHQGHLSLIRRARKDNESVVVSIFVNPAQFGPREDFDKYPRDFKKDSRLCSEAGVDFIFYPCAQEMYPEGYKTYITVNGLSDVLCGRSRPGHFRGVATVVSKLFNIVQADVAYFGQKDAQQAIIIKKMVSDLNMPVNVKILPTIREKDGLAMSSRNVYLGKDERKESVVLYQALVLAGKMVKKGTRICAVIIKKMKSLIEKSKNAKIDYVEIVDLDNLSPIKEIKDKALVALAVRIGKTRLIDNIIINPNGNIGI